MKSNLTSWVAAMYNVKFSLHSSFVNFSVYKKSNDVKYSSYLAVEIIMAITHCTCQNVSKTHLRVLLDICLTDLGCTEKSRSLTAWTTSQPSEFCVFRIEFFPVHSQRVHLFSVPHVWYPVSWYQTGESKQLPDAVDWLLFVLNMAAQPKNLLFTGGHDRLNSKYTSILWRV